MTFWGVLTQSNSCCDGSLPAPFQTGLPALCGDASLARRRWLAQDYRSCSVLPETGIVLFLGRQRTRVWKACLPLPSPRRGSGTLRNIEVKGSRTRVLRPAFCPSPSDLRSSITPYPLSDSVSPFSSRVPSPGTLREYLRASPKPTLSSSPRPAPPSSASPARRRQNSTYLPLPNPRPTSPHPTPARPGPPARSPHVG